ncbi:AmmeMemoRadiSam system radical SAM enzyme [bacterium]|nr:AmmeMemoRadiSam system radical SAM enzyme [bacterium]
MKEAAYFSLIDEESKKVQCFLCPHKCIIEDGNLGNCRVRKNIEGKLYALAYNRYVSAGMDPMEKKPLYHFFPGHKILSLGNVGCNLHCRFCQNWGISQREAGEGCLREITTEETIRLAKSCGSIGIAYTYNEPLINYEYLLETAIEAQKCGLKNVLITNGYINEAPLVNLLPYIDAANIDVKSFRNDFYREYCKGTLSDVLRTAEIMYRHNKHIEFTNLLIPGLNDREEVIEDLIDWVYSLSPDIPLHFTRYFPCYKMTQEATPWPVLQRAREIALKKLNYVYLGNVMEEESSSTFCPGCEVVLIERKGYDVKLINLEEGHCSRCGEKINIVI